MITNNNVSEKMEMCYAMRINCLTHKELTYSILTSPQITQTNTTHYVEINQVGYRKLPTGDWKLEMFPSNELLDNFSKI